MVASSLPESDTNKNMSAVKKSWGKGEFTEKWSDHHGNWDYADESKKQRIGFNPNKTKRWNIFSYHMMTLFQSSGP